MSTKFTPGPWSAIDGNFVYSENRIDGAIHSPVRGLCYPNRFSLNLMNDGDISDSEIAANAALIAAAPEMYDALEAILKFTDSVFDTDEPIDKAAHEHEWARSALKAHTALKKARGE